MDKTDLTDLIQYRQVKIIIDSTNYHDTSNLQNIVNTYRRVFSKADDEVKTYAKLNSLLIATGVIVFLIIEFGGRFISFFPFVAIGYIVLFIYFIRSMTRYLDAKKRLSKLKRYMSIQFEYRSNGWDDMKKLVRKLFINSIDVDTIDGIHVNTGIVKFQKWYITPFHFIRFSNDILQFYSHEKKNDMFKYRERTLPFTAAGEYTYKQLSYKKWKHPRNDGGPDRRFNDNYQIYYYKVFFLDFNGKEFNIPNENIVLDFKRMLKAKKSHAGQTIQVETLKDNSYLFDRYKFTVGLLEYFGIEYIQLEDKIEFIYQNQRWTARLDGKVIGKRCYIEKIIEGSDNYGRY